MNSTWKFSYRSAFIGRMAVLFANNKVIAKHGVAVGFWMQQQLNRSNVDVGDNRWQRICQKWVIACAKASAYIRTRKPLNEIYRVIFIECDIRDPQKSTFCVAHFVRIRLMLRRCKRMYTTVMCAVTQSLLSRMVSFFVSMCRCESRSNKWRDWREQSKEKKNGKQSECTSPSWMTSREMDRIHVVNNVHINTHIDASSTHSTQSKPPKKNESKRS